MFALMRARCFFFSSALLVLANGAFADDGAYQRTKDGKTIVWNTYPLPGETAEWSGNQDKEGYATGYGTVTWYKLAHSGYTFAKSKHSVVSGVYSGTMVKGKFEGVVVRPDRGTASLIRWNTAASDRTTHATFVAGNRTSEWVAGPGPSPSKTNATPDKPAEERPGRTGLSEEGAVATTTVQGPSPGPRQSPKPKISPPAKEAAKPVEDSLQSVAAPPSSLQMDRSVKASPEPSVAPPLPPPTTTSESSTDRTQLTTREAIELADGVARANGIDLTRYQNPQAQYVPEDEAWSVSYDQKSNGGTPEPGRNFIVSVGDKTKRTSIGPGKY